MAQRTIAKNDDLTALYNQAYPNASAAQADTLAQTQKAVDDMTLRDRIWDSLNYSYGVQRRQSDEAYANQISQQNRSMLGRGMQRSSYGAATEANMRNKQVQAQNDIYGQQIAAYENALLNVEQQEQEQENWEKQFAESVRQFDILHPQNTGGGGGGYSSSRSSGGSKKKTTTTQLPASDSLLEQLANTMQEIDTFKKNTVATNKPKAPNPNPFTKNTLMTR